ncbi:MAG: acyl-CoA dehydrogenase family protein [Chrysiogenetes bacterium]|nr:acyl-CoA dehydrogenase family protein [Chrysiogenetes bacterium]
MDLELSEEQRQTVETIRRFLEKEIKPHVERWDHQNEYPTEARDAFKEMGLYGAIIPTEYGGLGWDTVTYALVITELAACWMTLSSMINTQMIMAHSVLDAGTEEQKKKWLPKMATGEMRGGLALSEAHGGSDVAGMLTTAKKDGDVYRINGSKMWITNSDGNSFFLLAKTDTTCSPPHGGISGFIMETGAEGFKVSRDIPKLGLKGIPTSELSFEDFPVPAENLLGGKEGQGFVQVMRGLELGRINVAARSVGVLRAEFEASIKYAQERETFGKPIWQHQLVGAKLADMAADLEASRLLVLSAAIKKEKGERCDLEASMAKLFASRACAQHALEAMHIHGGYGYTKEFPVERFYRDAPLMTIGEGSNDILKTVIAKNLIKRFAI